MCFSIFFKMISIFSKFITAYFFPDSLLPSNINSSCSVPIVLNTLGKFYFSEWLNIGKSNNKLSCFLKLTFSWRSRFLLIVLSYANFDITVFPASTSFSFIFEFFNNLISKSLKLLSNSELSIYKLSVSLSIPLLYSELSVPMISFILSSFE